MGTRQPFAAGLLFAFLIGVTCAPTTAEEPKAKNTKFVSPPGEETADIRDLIDKAKTALESGRTLSEVLTDGTFLPARAWPRFRKLVRDYAPDTPVTLIPASEPGDLLHVRGTVSDADGKPVSGALLYVYHTSHKGWYSDQAAHISGDSGDVKHARLFAYLKTDAKGKYEFRTIRPVGYPDTDLPAHIHVQVDSPDKQPKAVGTEIRFEDDPRLTAEWRERSRKEGCLICEVKKGSDKTQTVVADFRFR